MKNKKLTILVSFGTRPEAIKLAPLVDALKKLDSFEIVICSISQHIEMLNQVLNVFDIKVDIDLKIMKKNQNLYDITSNVVKRFKKVLDNVKPDCVIVQGDTTSAFAVALASYYKSIPVAHVEAGLRTYNIYSPFPEEINRQLIARIATLHFAPSELAQKNLIREGIDKARIFVTGNTGIDALFFILNRIENMNVNLPGYRITNRKIILVTAHRRENFGEPLRRICDSLQTIAEMFPQIDILFPVHLNPNVRNVVINRLRGINNIYLLEPLDYLQLVYVLKNSYLVLTDSGGLQEEAPYLGKPVLILRENTERPEVILSGNGELVGSDPEKIIYKVKKLIEDPNYYMKMSKVNMIYGDGSASYKITKILKSVFTEKR